MNHHMVDDAYWLAFTVPAVDTLFGTNPDAAEVARERKRRDGDGGARRVASTRATRRAGPSGRGAATRRARMTKTPASGHSSHWRQPAGLAH